LSRANGIQLPAIDPAPGESSPAWYSILFGVLIAFGFVAIASIGMPFLLLGMTLALLGPYRHRPEVFWPPLIAILTLVVGFLLVAPVTCRGTETSTVCDNLIGIDYSGAGDYNPSLLPALFAGLGSAVVAGALSRVALVHRYDAGAKSGGRTVTSGGSDPKA